jgi:hypothetical protein
VPEPHGEAAAGLVAEPEPGEFDRRRAQAAVPGLRDPLLAVDAAAGEGRADQAGVGAERLGRAELRTKPSRTRVVAVCTPTPRSPASRRIIAAAGSPPPARSGTASRCASTASICAGTSSSRSSIRRIRASAFAG